nr:paraquat-inducible protein A [Motiliproteus sp. SC1-56]
MLPAHFPAQVFREPRVDHLPPEKITKYRRLRACHECDWLMALPRLKAGEMAKCPRCATPLVRRHRRPAQRSMALAVAALIALAVSLAFPFFRLSLSGIETRLDLPGLASTLLAFEQPIVAITVMLTVMVLPLLFLLAVIWLQYGLLRGRPLPASRSIARALTHLYPWMMADVFVTGALVSLIKVSGMGDFELGPAFWAFCAFETLFLFCLQSLDPDWLWFALAGEPRPPRGARPGDTAARQGVAGCPTCGVVNRLSATGWARCRRCAERYPVRRPHSLQQTWALILAASLMYLPANIYPMMTSQALGQVYPGTILGGIVAMFELGSWFVAIVIFAASVVIPIGKIMLLAWLCLVARRGEGVNARARTRVYRVIDFIGRWSMVDIFVMTIVVSLVQAGSLVSITPGPAALAFGAVVILSMLAVMAFDSRLIWDSPDQATSANPEGSAP